MNNSFFTPASQEELLFIRKHKPKFFVAMIQERTRLNRSQVLYQLMQMPENQNPDVIQAARDILYAVKQIRYSDDSGSTYEKESILTEEAVFESEKD